MAHRRRRLPCCSDGVLRGINACIPRPASRSDASQGWPRCESPRTLKCESEGEMQIVGSSCPCAPCVGVFFGRFMCPTGPFHCTYNLRCTLFLPSLSVGWWNGSLSITPLSRSVRLWAGLSQGSAVADTPPQIDRFVYAATSPGKIHCPLGRAVHQHVAHVPVSVRCCSSFFFNVHWPWSVR